MPLSKEKTTTQNNPSVISEPKMDPIREWTENMFHELIDEQVRWEIMQKLKYEIHQFAWYNEEDQAQIWWKIESCVVKSVVKELYNYHVHNIPY